MHDKNTDLGLTGYRPQPRRHHSIRLRLCYAAIAVLGSVVYLQNKNKAVEYVASTRKHSDKPFHWASLEPSPKLNFEKCYGEFECARLEVPLDWTDPLGDKRRAAVAVVRLPAKVPVTDSRYGGSVLVNPGGPGGSGVGFGIRTGKEIQTVVSATGNTKTQNTEGLYFDVIGFDPRGVNNTTPSASCFPDDVSANAWSLVSSSEGWPVSNSSFERVWSRTAALSESCAWRLGSKDDHVMESGRFMSTPSVVEDMVAISEALGEWRQRESKALYQWHKGQEKLLYWGFSYGTLLGASFASMHPDRVGRLALDGVVDADDYYEAKWSMNLLDTDSIIESFFRQCKAAGKGLCPIYSDNVDDIRKRYDNVLKDLAARPIAVPATETTGAQVVTFFDLMQIVRFYVYAPRDNAAKLSRLIYEISKGNASELANDKEKAIPSSCRNNSCQKHPWGESCYNVDKESPPPRSGLGIECVDGKDLSNTTREDYYLNWKRLTQQSKVLGGFWSTITMRCASFHLRPKWKFEQKIAAEKTAHPILWLSNTRDPVTPLVDARKMATRFPGSIVFGQDADGHCTQSQPSRCVNKGIRDYFQTGRLPKGDVTCVPDRGYFESAPEDLSTLSIEDRELTIASENFLKHFHKHDLPLGI